MSTLFDKLPKVYYQVSSSSGLNQNSDIIARELLSDIQTQFQAQINAGEAIPTISDATRTAFDPEQVSYASAIYNELSDKFDIIPNPAQLNQLKKLSILLAKLADAHDVVNQYTSAQQNQTMRLYDNLINVNERRVAFTANIVYELLAPYNGSLHSYLANQEGQSSVDPVTLTTNDVRLALTDHQIEIIFGKYNTGLYAPGNQLHLWFHDIINPVDHNENPYNAPQQLPPVTQYVDANNQVITDPQIIADIKAGRPPAPTSQPAAAAPPANPPAIAAAPPPPAPAPLYGPRRPGLYDNYPPIPQNAPVAPPPQAYPPQSYPQQSYPQQAYPQQAYPPQQPANPNYSYQQTYPQQQPVAPYYQPQPYARAEVRPERPRRDFFDWLGVIASGAQIATTIAYFRDRRDREAYQSYTQNINNYYVNLRNQRYWPQNMYNYYRNNRPWG